MITHNQDIFEEDTFKTNGELLGYKGEPKKEHIHICLMCGKPIDKLKIKQYVGIDLKWIEPFRPKYIKDKLLYLCHKKHPNKHQYDFVEIYTNRYEYVKSVYEEYDAIKQPITIYDIFNNLDKKDKHIKYKDFVSICIDNEINLKDIKSYWYLFKDLIKEHNDYKDNKDIAPNSSIIEMYRAQEKYIEKLHSLFPNLKIDNETYERLNYLKGEYEKYED